VLEILRIRRSKEHMARINKKGGANDINDIPLLYLLKG